ncbi:hypothetical protein MJO29_003932, partial [Puccinia striiformis f. sp. tritici]
MHLTTFVCTLIHPYLMDPPNNPIELGKQSCHDKKVLLVCKILQNPPTKMTPKEFIFHFVSSENSKITYLCRYWSPNTGVKGAMDLVRALRNKIKETPLGRSLWEDLIQEEVSSADEALDEEQQTTKALDEAVESDEISGSDHLEIPDKTGGIADEERHKNPRDRALQQARR